MLTLDGKADLLSMNISEIAEYLATTDFDPKRIAVERNGDIVFKSKYAVTVLKDGDCLVIVSFVGGG